MSVNLDSLKDQKAKGVVFKEPPSEYKKKSQKGLDVLWENPTDKSSLSFFSNCSEAHQFTSLGQFQSEILEGLRAFRIIRREQKIHQGQLAHQISLVKTKKQKISLQLFLFKKEKCFYTLSFLIPETKTITLKQQQIFKDFIREFRGP